MYRKYRFLFFLVTVLTGLRFSAYSQTDSTKKLTIDSLVSRQKGILKKFAQNFLTDTINDESQQLSRNDAPFQEYRGRIIRKIDIQTLEFGTSIGDTTKRLSNKLIHLSNKLHYQTRNFVIREHLFFKEKDKASPYLLGDNEKHLRDLPFIQDAKFIIEPVNGLTDSIDIVIRIKDVLSFSGGLNLHDNQSAGLTFREANFMGLGDQLEVQTLYDLNRNPKFGYGFAYIERNIMGSFIDGAAGHLNFQGSISTGKKEETMTYLQFVKPLVTRYMKWTYGLEMSLHQTLNVYHEDSLYVSDLKYKYHVADVWGTWNIDADKLGKYNDNDRLHRLVSLRILNQGFSIKPLVYTNQYNFRYADKAAILSTFSIFKQNFYKTRYIYGFGRNEDVPEGGEASFTLGYTKTNGRVRPYSAINIQRYFFNNADQYYNYTIRLGTYLHKYKPEDVNILANLDFFTRLYQLHNNWKQRTFLSVSAARQLNYLYNEPLVLESEYGLREFNNNGLGATQRLTLKGESVFFSPLSLLFFKVAPFVFANASLMKVEPKNSPHKLYSAIGGGVRIRNESLIFGTIELKGMYFPQKTFFNHSWRFDLGTNIRFRYNKEFIRHPEFVNVN